MRSRKNAQWVTPKDGDFQWQHVSVELLMDIRDELQRLNSLLACPNFVGIPGTLRSIDRKLAKRRKPKPSATK